MMKWLPGWQSLQAKMWLAGGVLTALTAGAAVLVLSAHPKAALSALTVLALALGLTGIVLYRHVNGRLAELRQACATAAEPRRADEFDAVLDQLAQVREQYMEQLQGARTQLADLNDMVQIILEVVDQAAQGNLTEFLMEFSGDEPIDQLANRVRAMIQHLNELISSIKFTGIQVTQSTTEIAGSSTQQEATVTELAATTTQIAATTTQIASTAQELVHRMEESYAVAETAAASAEQGHGGIRGMDESMQTMVQAVDTIASKLSVLSEKAENINMVVSTITKISDQTNLLSLNAAIEAEKAGEYGKGFAVVATEIRRLADQTAVSTWDIEQMVKEIQSAVSSSVMATDQFSKEIHCGVEHVGNLSEQFTAITEHVQGLLPCFSAVKESIRSQAEGANQISESIRQMDETTHETAESLRKSSAAIRGLKSAVQEMSMSVGRFKVD